MSPSPGATDDTAADPVPLMIAKDDGDEDEEPRLTSA
jgi:hypothetical protein